MKGNTAEARTTNAVKKPKKTTRFPQVTWRPELERLPNHLFIEIVAQDKESRGNGQACPTTWRPGGFFLYFSCICGIFELEESRARATDLMAGIVRKHSYDALRL